MPAGQAFCQNTPKKIGITNKGHAGPVHTSGRTRDAGRFLPDSKQRTGKIPVRFITQKLAKGQTTHGLLM